MKWQGKGVSEGLAMAQIHLFTPKLPEISRQPAADAEAEVAKLEATLAAAEEELRGLYETAKEKMGEQEAEIFDAHLTILGDEYSVREPIIQRIREQKQNAAAAIEDQFDELAQMFRSLGDELMAERAADAEDLKQQLLRICLGCGRQDLSVLPGDVIVLARVDPTRDGTEGPPESLDTFDGTRRRGGKGYQQATLASKQILTPGPRPALLAASHGVARHK